MFLRILIPKGGIRAGKDVLQLLIRHDRDTAHKPAIVQFEPKARHTATLAVSFCSTATLAAMDTTSV